MNWFKYKVVWWCEVEDKDLTAYGITCGESYVEAMTNIEKHFGDTIQSIEHLEMIGDFFLHALAKVDLGDNF